VISALSLHDALPIWNLEDYRKAVGYFDQAIRLDPDYALAYTERSEAWSFIGDLTGQHEPAWSNARSDAEKAVAIAPDLAEAHARSEEHTSELQSPYD